MRIALFVIAAIALSRSAASAPPAFEISTARGKGGSAPSLLVIRDNARGLEASIAPSEGGELSSFRVRRQGRWVELLERANDYGETAGWQGKAPLLWPATGRNVAPDGDRGKFAGYQWQGKRYPMPAHGFARRMAWRTVRHAAGPDKASVELRLSDSAETRRHYPFGFAVTVTYTLAEGRLAIRYDIAAAPDNKEDMFFSIGNHMTFRVPFIEGGNAGALRMETPSTVEYLKSGDGLPTGQSRPRKVSPPVRLADFDARTAVSLGGYTGNPWLRLTDPAGISLTIEHQAQSLPAPPVVQFNLWGDPRKGYFSPEPWVGLQNSFVLRQGVVMLPPGRDWQWRIDLKPEVIQ